MLVFEEHLAFAFLQRPFEHGLEVEHPGLELAQFVKFLRCGVAVGNQDVVHVTFSNQQPCLGVQGEIPVVFQRAEALGYRPGTEGAWTGGADERSNRQVVLLDVLIAFPEMLQGESGIALGIEIVAGREL